VGIAHVPDQRLHGFQNGIGFAGVVFVGALADDAGSEVLEVGIANRAEHELVHLPDGCFREARRRDVGERYVRAICFGRHRLKTFGSPYVHK